MSSSTLTTRADQVRIGDRITIRRPSGPAIVRVTDTRLDGRSVSIRYAGEGIDGVLRPLRTAKLEVTL